MGSEAEEGAVFERIWIRLLINIEMAMKPFSPRS
jgi:hypothetical protein